MSGGYTYTNDVEAAQEVRNRLKEIHYLIHEIEKKRMQSEKGINEIIRGQQDEKPLTQNSLKAMYREAIRHCEEEEKELRDALGKINEIRTIKHERRIHIRMKGNEVLNGKANCLKMLQNMAKTLPLFIGKIDEKPPPLCGAIPPEPHYHAKIGDMVAAYVIIDMVEHWIITEVIKYHQDKYEVSDVLKEQNQKERYTLHKRYVIPMPLMRANPETDPGALYLPDTRVMAIYPQTTVFYEAVVRKLPVTHVDDYELSFKDDNGDYGAALPVPQGLIIPLVQIKQRNKSL